jgi:hypothetical protein
MLVVRKEAIAIAAAIVVKEDMEVVEDMKVVVAMEEEDVEVLEAQGHLGLHQSK